MCARPAELDQARGLHTAAPRPWEGMRVLEEVEEKNQGSPQTPSSLAPPNPLCLYACAPASQIQARKKSVLKEENHVSLIPAFDFCLDVLVQGIKVVSLMRLHIIVSQELLKGCF